MSIYIEVVIIENLIIDYLLLKTTFSITGLVESRWRVIVSSIIGSVFAVLFPLIETNDVLQIFLKFFTGIFIFCLSNKFSNVKCFYYNLLVFFMLVFLCGGGVYAFYYLFNISISSNIAIICVIIPLFAIVKTVKCIISFVYSRKDIISNIVVVKIEIAGLSKSVKGLVDSGNCAFFNNIPVIFVDRKMVLCNGFNCMLLKEVGIINTLSIGGESKSKVFEIDSLFIDGEKVNKKVYCAFTDVNDYLGFKIILNSDVIGEKQNGVNRKIKKAC